MIEVAYGGVCGSDLHYWTHGAAGESILRAPMVLGHEVVGDVVQSAADGGAGGGHTRRRAPRHPAGRRGDPLSRRPSELVAGLYLPRQRRPIPAHDGAFAKYATLPTRMLQAAARLGRACGRGPGRTSLGGLARRRAGRRRTKDKSALVVGAGPIGALSSRCSSRRGPPRSPPSTCTTSPARTPRKLGATRTLVATQTDQIAAVQADIVLESSGSHRGLASAIRGAARGGRVVMVGLLPTGDQPIPISLAITRELELVGAFRFNDEIDEVIAALADGAWAPTPSSPTSSMSPTRCKRSRWPGTGHSSKVLLRF